MNIRMLVLLAIWVVIVGMQTFETFEYEEVLTGNDIIDFILIFLVHMVKTFPFIGILYLIFC